MKSLSAAVLSLCLLGELLFAPTFVSAQALPANRSQPVTPPRDFLGFNIGDDYCLANYQQLKGYWETLERQSDRIKLVSIGTTAEGRPQLAAIVTAPANHRRLDQYRQIARRLALADGVDEAEARVLAADGKAVVWIDAGIHATETLCPQAMIESVYQFVTGHDPETLRILDDVIILFVHANPDGHDLVADWYMREKEPAKRSFAGLPRLYQKYVGHDNNRDFYANTQAETKNLNRFMYREWYPQVMYNHHQSGPPGTVLFCPPFRDPFNYFCDPLVINGIDALGAAMVQRFLVEGKPGATIRSGAPYSTWFNGGLRTASSFHNIIGLLTETIGSPTPSRIPLVAAKQLAKGDYLAPIPPQTWHLRQSVEYSLTANRAVLDYASRNRELLLYNVWLMGHRAIERGSRDSWTITPKLVDAAQPNRSTTDRGTPRGGGSGIGGGVAEFEKFFRNPAKRDARGYIVPADQTDFPTATKFINTLLGTGVRVHRATADFTVAGVAYPRNSYVVKTAQAYRAHVLDMFEPQDHPNDFSYPGGPPIRPYDSAGYTPAFQMAVKFDRILEGFDGPFEEIKESAVAPPPACVRDAENAVGFFLSVQLNDAFRAVNRLQKEDQEVRRLQQTVRVGDVDYPAGTFYVPRRANTLALLETIAPDLGTPFRGTSVAPGPEAVVLRTPRIGLWDRYGGSMPSGWTRWLLEQFEFPFRLVYAPELDEGNLREKFDVLILVDGAISSRGGPGAGGGRGGGGVGGGDRPDAAAAGDAEAPAVPNSSVNTGADPYLNQRGRITLKATLPPLKAFLEAGGTLLTIGTSTELGKALGLPLANHLAEIDDKGQERALPAETYYVPSSVLRVRVDPSQPLSWGQGDEVDVMFSSSPTFRLSENDDASSLRRVAWFDTRTPLRSGWAWGQEHLEGGVAIIDAPIGKGRLALFGPQILFRGQSHGSFKFLFNGIVQAAVGEAGE